jgi:hypothetical protein
MQTGAGQQQHAVWSRLPTQCGVSNQLHTIQLECKHTPMNISSLSAAMVLGVRGQVTTSPGQLTCSCSISALLFLSSRPSAVSSSALSARTASRSSRTASSSRASCASLPVLDSVYARASAACRHTPAHKHSRGSVPLFAPAPLVHGRPMRWRQPAAG